MKVRKRAKPKRVSTLGRNVLKADPSRTVTLRRQFAAELRRRFARLKGKVVSLVEKEDAFGLGAASRAFAPLSNVFCPTGPGGGVDPGCSPDESGGASGGGASGGVTSGAAAGVKKMMAKVGLRESFDRPDDPAFHDGRRRRVEDVVVRVAGATASHGDSVTVTFDEKKGRTTVWRGHEDSASHDFLIEPHEGGRLELWGQRRVLISPSMPDDEVEYLAYKADARKAPKDLASRYDAKYRKSARVTNAANTRWPGGDADRVKAFQQWLRTQVDDVGLSDEELWVRYTEAGFRKGAGRAFDDVNRRKRALSSADKSSLDFYSGTRDQFLRSAFGRPVATEKVKLLAGRSFSDLKGITNDMATRMTRVLTDGLVQGKGPREVARDLVDEVDISVGRVETIARTEIIRAHAEGQLEALEDLGVSEVGVAVEWLSAGDDKVCPACEALEGVVLKLDEAHGLLPRHPGCRCAFAPANVGEDGADQKDTKRAIDKALKESAGDDDWPGAEATIARRRPESVLNVGAGAAPVHSPVTDDLRAFSRFLVTANVFCPTGPGGGVDPTCGKDDAGAPPYHRLLAAAQETAEKAPGLSERQRAEYADAAGSVLGSVPEAGLERMARHVESWHFYHDQSALNAGVAPHLPGEVRAAVESGQADVGGAFLNGRLHLGEARPMETASALGGTVNNIHHLYAHELMHAIDGPQFSLSKTEPWAVAWAGEVLGVNDAPGAHPRLSPRAKDSLAEGFAEFGRLVLCGSDDQRARLGSLFPRCAAYFRGAGLWR